jgi:CubicO group peptidase (beta-lactamase class C family)
VKTVLRNAIAWCALILAVLAAGTSRADDMPRAQPAELGFSAERLDAMDHFYGEKVKKGELSGIVLLVARHGKVAHLSAIGYADTGSHKAMQEDSIFRLYSMTKPVAATALMLLYEEGKFQLDDPIWRYIPDFSGVQVLRTPESALSDTVAPVREPTIHDLFRHTAGLMHGGANPPKSPIDEAYRNADIFDPAISLEEMVRRIAKLPLHFQPGTKFEYSVVQDVQARLVEVLSGMSFDQFLGKVSVCSRRSA